MLSTRCNSPLRVTESCVDTCCFANRSQISTLYSCPNLDQYLLSSQTILRTAIKRGNAAARSQPPLLSCSTLTYEPWFSNTVSWPVSHAVTCWSKQSKRPSLLLNICKSRSCFNIQSWWCTIQERPVFLYLCEVSSLMTSPSQSCFETWNSFGHLPFPSLLHEELGARSNRVQAALLEEEKAARRTCKHVFLYIASIHILYDCY